MSTTVNIREGHDNNFTVLRAIMALAVLVGHAMIIGARDMSAEPMVYGTFSISYMAVNAFFVASGFLVTASMLHRGSLSEFAAARGLRIYPALIVHVLLVKIVVGLFNTTLPALAYLSHPDVWTQPFRVLSFLDTDFILPGVFESNYESYASAPLWTLRYEMLAYVGTGLAFALGLTRAKWMVAAQFYLFALAWPIAHWTGLYEQLPNTFQLILRFGLPYGLGAMIYVYRDELPFRLWLIPILMAVALGTADTALGEVSMNLMVGYVLFWLAYAKMPMIAPLSRKADLSYGIYIWHWPILQWMAAQWAGVSTAELLLVGLPLTCLAAWLSWHLVEQPMLARKSVVADWLKRRRRDERLVTP